MVSLRSILLILATAGYGLFLAGLSLVTICRTNGSGCYQTVGVYFPPILMLPAVVLIVGLVLSLSSEEKPSVNSSDNHC